MIIRFIKFVGEIQYFSIGRVQSRDISNEFQLIELRNELLMEPTDEQSEEWSNLQLGW